MQQILSLWREQISFSNLKMIALATLHRWQQVWLTASNVPFFMVSIVCGLIYFVAVRFFVPTILFGGAVFSIIPFIAAVVIYLSRESVGAKTFEHFVRLFISSFLNIVVCDLGVRFFLRKVEAFSGTMPWFIILSSILYVFFISLFICASYDQKNFFVSLRAAGTLMIAYTPIILASIVAIIFGIYIVFPVVEIFFSYAIMRSLTNTASAAWFLLLVSILIIGIFMFVTLAISAASVMYTRVIHNHYDLLYK